MSRIDLPDGEWAEFASPKKVSERRRRAYVHAMSAFNRSTAEVPRDEKGEPDGRYFGVEQAELLDVALDLLAVALIKAWSFDLPVTTDTLQELDGGCFDVIRKAAIAMQPEMLPDYSPDPDPKAPTGGSSPPPTASSMDGSTFATR